jgi:hypothetical protein
MKSSKLIIASVFTLLAIGLGVGLYIMLSRKNERFRNGDKHMLGGVQTPIHPISDLVGKYCPTYAKDDLSTERLLKINDNTLRLEYNVRGDYADYTYIRSDNDIDFYQYNNVSILYVLNNGEFVYLPDNLVRVKCNSQ